MRKIPGSAPLLQEGRGARNVDAMRPTAPAAAIVEI